MDDPRVLWSEKPTGDDESGYQVSYLGPCRLGIAKWRDTDQWSWLVEELDPHSGFLKTIDRGVSATKDDAKQAALAAAEFWRPSRVV